MPPATMALLSIFSIFGFGIVCGVLIFAVCFIVLLFKARAAISKSAAQAAAIREGQPDAQ
jgi:hypothetical protein